MTHVEGHGQFGEWLAPFLRGEANGHIINEPCDGAVRPDDGVGVEVGRGVEREGVLKGRKQGNANGKGHGANLRLTPTRRRMWRVGEDKDKGAIEVQRVILW